MKIAETSNERHKLACAITHKKTILGFGLNSDKSDSFQSKYSNHAEKIYRHAETDAIKRVSNKYGTKILENCVLYIVRIKRPYVKANFFIRGMAKPCSGCMKAISEFKIKKVVYTTDIGIGEL